MCRRSLALFVVAGALVLAGCGSPPSEDIAAADRAMSEARSVEAADYAPDSLQTAEQARADLDAELKAQEDKFALFRSYDRAKELASAASQAAEQAKVDAVEGKEAAREEASARITTLRDSVLELQQMLDSAPKGKGSQADLAMLRSDLGGVEATLGELDQAFADERYAEAITKAESATTSLEAIRAEIDRAMEMAKSRRGRS